ncbi:MAG: 3-dehydroquinate synthase [Alphaproteobacteria bacterium]|nr:3-dehydroquinate synthase [Alphaproteobacteria bacterium]
MNTRKTLSVALADRSYDIIVGHNLLRDAGQLIDPIITHEPVIVVTDDNVAGHHLGTLDLALQSAGIASTVITLPAGENTKDYDGFHNLVTSILDIGPERRSTLIALGGGVIGDITGFAASVILRGIDFIQIPTTLLAQVDSSVGGKTGINTQHGKNLVGSFYQPRLVLADTGTLDTLPRRELLAGYAEVVKYGLLGDKAFFEWLEKNADALIDGDETLRQQSVITSCRTKANIVSRDEKETGDRALLNLGHTFGHALEAETGFGEKLLHGEAVAIGIMMAFDLSTQIGLCPVEDTTRVRAHFKSVGLPVQPTDISGQAWSSTALLGHMAQDKKVRDGKITFILTRGIGNAFITSDVKISDVEALLDKAIAA